MKQSFGPAPVRPFPYVEGQTRRIKAEPTKLSGVAVRVMAASGNFSTRRSAGGSSQGLWLGAFAFALIAAAIAIVGGDARTGDRAEAAYSVMPAQVQAAGARDAAPPATIPPASLPDTAGEPKAQAAAAKRDAALEALDAQDRFEIERFVRLTAAANETLAPAAGPATR